MMVRLTTARMLLCLAFCLADPARAQSPESRDALQRAIAERLHASQERLQTTRARDLQGRLVATSSAGEAVRLMVLLGECSIAPDLRRELVVPLLDHAIGDVRSAALNQLLAEGLVDEVLADRVLALAESDEQPADLRAAAVRALGRLEPVSERPVDRLAALLVRSDSGLVQRGVLDALAFQGAASRAHLRAIEAFLDSVDGEVAIAAFQARGRILDSRGAESFDPSAAGARADGGYADVRALVARASQGASNELLSLLGGEAPMPLLATALEAMTTRSWSEPAIGQAILGRLDTEAASTDGALARRLEVVAGQLSAEDAAWDAPVAEWLATGGALVLPHAARLADERSGAGSAMLRPALTLWSREGFAMPGEALDAALRIFRREGVGTEAVQRALLRLKDASDPRFEGQNRVVVAHLRGHGLATLAVVGVPPEARPWLTQTLRTSEAPIEIAGAARAVAALGPGGRFAIDDLLRILEDDRLDHFVTFVEFLRMGVTAPPDQRSSSHREVLLAIAAVSPEGQARTRALDAVNAYLQRPDRRADAIAAATATREALR